MIEAAAASAWKAAVGRTEAIAARVMGVPLLLTGLHQTPPHRNLAG